MEGTTFIAVIVRKQPILVVLDVTRQWTHMPIPFPRSVVSRLSLEKKWARKPLHARAPRICSPECPPCSHRPRALSGLDAAGSWAGQCHSGMDRGARLLPGTLQSQGLWLRDCAQAARAWRGGREELPGNMAVLLLPEVVGTRAFA